MPMPSVVPADPRPSARGHRNDALDGLRFLAVAAVMAYHFGVPGSQGGFLGVDLFFVLSGFLITGVLLRQVERRHVDLASFWTRRVRRLAPALVLGLAAVIAWGALAAPVTERDGLRGDITGTLAYVANWHFISSSSYFASTGDESPLQHMWSLAVEEQFYVAWPLLLWVVCLLVRPARLRLGAVGALALGGIAFSAWRLEALWGSAGADRAYMGTDSRIFGPLVGALLAVVLARTPELGARLRSHVALLAAGALGVVWGFAALGSQSGATTRYPGGGALLFALSSAALIWALATRTSGATRALAWMPVAYLGRLSYGMYIWHWPLVVWAAPGQLLDLSGVGAVTRVLVLTLATIALASLSYHLVEKPIRYGTMSMRLDPRRIAIALPATLGALLLVNTTFVVPRAGAAQGSVTRTIVLVGDSVPQRLATDLGRAASKWGYVVIAATRGSCPATGVLVVDATGKPTGAGRACPESVPGRQDAAVARYRPALVLWWSRYEVADRQGPDGKALPVGSAAYWSAQETAFDARVQALTARGARLVAVQIERSGVGMSTRCTPTACGPLLYRLVHRTDLQDRWNTFLAGHHGPSVFSVSLARFVCRDSASPCDDRLADGSPARPDGTHYSDEAAPRVAVHVVAAALRASGLAHA
jgi:peptidoglycan/LPS O-acetylase OafA/YrhL